MYSECFSVSVSAVNKGPGRESIKHTVELVSTAKPSKGCAYACPEVEKNITPLELWLSYCVIDVLRISLKQVPP